MDARILIGDCRQVLKSLQDKSVHCVVTSPPYFGLRNYENEAQIGLEMTPEEYVSQLVDVFLQVHRVLRDDGTVWLNLGDSYAGGGCGARDPERWPKQSRNDHMPTHAKKNSGLPSKNLIGIPWLVAFALQKSGWMLRQDIVWSKPNPMPESVRDRCTKSHEYVFLLSKRSRYYFDNHAIKEPVTASTQKRLNQPTLADQIGSNRVPGKTNGSMKAVGDGELRNRRSVWTISTKPFRGAHFATFPIDLAEPCILAGCPIGGAVLDPFGGSGTVALAANKHGRHAVLIELNRDYAAIAEARVRAAHEFSLLDRVQVAA